VKYTQQRAEKAAVYLSTKVFACANGENMSLKGMGKYLSTPRCVMAAAASLNLPLHRINRM
jgi:hypothetical protein